MNLSAEGKNYLQQVLAESEVKTLRFYGTPGCCGMNVGITIDAAQEKDTVQTIEGIDIAIEPSIAEQLTDVTLHAEDENGEMGLVLLGYTPTNC